MAKYSAAVKYLRAIDLDPHHDKTVTIVSVSEDSLLQDGRTVRKWILWFAEVEGGLALNRGNGQVLCQLFGDETDQWVQKRITLFVDSTVRFNGENVAGIRIRPHAVADGF